MKFKELRLEYFEKCVKIENLIRETMSDLYFEHYFGLSFYKLKSFLEKNYSAIDEEGYKKEQINSLFSGSLLKELKRFARIEFNNFFNEFNSSSLEYEIKSLSTKRDDFEDRGLQKNPNKTKLIDYVLNAMKADTQLTGGVVMGHENQKLSLKRVFNFDDELISKNKINKMLDGFKKIRNLMAHEDGEKEVPEKILKIVDEKYINDNLEERDVFDVLTLIFRIAHPKPLYPILEI